MLFLDELPEFQRPVLEVLRQPIEDGEVTITRVAGTIRLPSRFMLVCAMNPCPCGWHGHPSGRCRCSAHQVAGYARRISGPMLDRMDIHVEVPAVEFDAMRRRTTPESSAVVRERVNAARGRQLARFQGTPVTCNAHMTPEMVGRFCTLDDTSEDLLRKAFDNLGLTARSHDRILRVARTIADLDGAEQISPVHIYYKLDKICPDTILVEVAVPGERWEVEFAADGEIVIEKFKSIGIFEEDELEVLLATYSD